MVKAVIYFLVFVVLIILAGMVMFVPAGQFIVPFSGLVAVVIGALSILSPLLFLLPLPRANLSPSFLSFLAILLFILVLPVGNFLAFISGLSCFLGCSSYYFVALPLLIIPMIIGGFRLLQMASHERSLMIAVNTTTVGTNNSPQSHRVMTIIGLTVGGFVILLILAILVLFALGVNF